LALKFGQKYYTSIRVSDAAGNVSSVVTSDYWEFFNPNDVSGIYFWYDAGDLSTLWQDDTCNTTPVTSNNDNVKCWKDKSPSGIPLKISNSAQSPYYADSRIVFNGTQKLNSVHSGVTFSNYDMFVVFDSVVLGGYILQWVHTIGTGRLFIYNTDSTYIWDHLDNINGTKRVRGGSNDITKPEVLHHFRTTSTSRTIYQNTNPMVSRNYPHTIIPTSLDFMNSASAKVAEFILTSESLSTADTEKLEAYLMCKAGLSSTLPSGHTYENDCP
jgi:hypothetical protein